MEEANGEPTGAINTPPAEPAAPIEQIEKPAPITIVGKVVREVKLKELFSIERQANVDFFGVTDGSSRIAWNPDDSTTVWLKLDAESTALLRQKNLELNALLEEIVSLTGVVERKVVLADISVTTVVTQKKWVEQSVEAVAEPVA